MISRFIFQIVGATITWIFKGFKGSINDEVAGPSDYSSKKYRNYILSFLILLLVAKIIEKHNENERSKIKSDYYEFRKTG